VVRVNESPKAAQLFPRQFYATTTSSSADVLFIERPIQVQVRLFKRSRNWNDERQALVNCDPQGEIDLRQVAQHLIIEGGCEVRRSEILNVKNLVMENGYLRIVAWKQGRTR